MGGENGQRGSRRVLVIDDNPLVCDLLREILESEGYEVLEAPNGHVGIRLHERRPADVVITDILMPEQDGIETIIELRDRFPDVKILAMSGGGNGGHVQPLQDAKRFGACCAISKPFDPAEVLLAVRQMLAAEE